MAYRPPQTLCLNGEGGRGGGGMDRPHAGEASWAQQTSDGSAEAKAKAVEPHNNPQEELPYGSCGVYPTVADIKSHIMTWSAMTPELWVLAVKG